MSETTVVRYKLDVEYIKACVRVAAHARRFAMAIAPLADLTFAQAAIWDDLTGALAVVEELEGNE